LSKIPTSFAKEVFFLNLLLLFKTLVNAPFPGVSRAFHGCFPGVPAQDFFSFTLLKILTTFAKEVFSKLAPFILKHASLTQNVSKCTFPGCFPGVSRVFPG
jgi:hypothetical protein